MACATSEKLGVDQVQEGIVPQEKKKAHLSSEMDKVSLESKQSKKEIQPVNFAWLLLN